MKMHDPERLASSPIPWLVDTPSHWQFRRAKFLFRKMNRPVRDFDEIVTAFRDGTVTLRSNRRTEGFTNALQEIGYQGIRQGDLVIHAMDGFAGAIGVSDSDGKASPVYSVCVPIEPSKVDAKYYAYALREMAQKGYITALARGIRERSTEFRYNEFQSQLLPVPPAKEQKVIADLLDRETVKLDQLVEKKQRFIELLQEKRQALITQAVSKGLNPNVPMKDSEIPWLGEVPAHWKVIKLKHLCSSVRDGTHNPPSRTDQGYPLLSVRNIVNDRLVRLPDDSLISGSDFQTLNRSFSIKSNDILLAIVGATLGKVAVVEEDTLPFTIQRSLAILRMKPDLLNHLFAYMYFRSSLFQRNLWENAGFSAQPGIYLGALANFHIICPPYGEQIEIVRYLQETTKILDTMEKKLVLQIGKLQEYRQTLISAAVSGQIDIRQYSGSEVASFSS